MWPSAVLVVSEQDALDRVAADGQRAGDPAATHTLSGERDHGMDELLAREPGRHATSSLVASSGDAASSITSATVLASASSTGASPSRPRRMMLDGPCPRVGNGVPNKRASRRAPVARSVVM